MTYAVSRTWALRNLIGEKLNRSPDDKDTFSYNKNNNGARGYQSTRKAEDLRTLLTRLTVYHTEN